jgi:hypothetical protein
LRRALSSPARNFREKRNRNVRSKPKRERQGSYGAIGSS